MSIITDQELLDRVEAFLTRTGMPHTRFGRDAMGEASFVPSLRKGRSLSLANANRVLKFIADHVDDDTAPCPAPETGKADGFSHDVGQAA